MKVPLIELLKDSNEVDQWKIKNRKKGVVVVDKQILILLFVLSKNLKYSLLDNIRIVAIGSIKTQWVCQLE